MSCRAVQGGGAIMPRRRRFDVDVGGGEPTTAGAGSACRCQSCAAVLVADCIAVGCCPCAVVSMLGLALVKAPLVVGRRCVGRLRRRTRTLHHNNRVRDDVGGSSATTTTAPDTEASDVDGDKNADQAGDDVVVGVDDTARAADDGDELAWLEEMYRTGHWGFGRVSFSAKTP